MDGEERFFLRTHSPSRKDTAKKIIKETLSTEDAGTVTAVSAMKREAPTSSDNNDNNTSGSSSSRKRANSSLDNSDNANSTYAAVRDSNSKKPSSIKRKESSATRMQNLLELTAEQSLQTKFPLGCQVIYNKTQSDSSEDEVVVSIGTVDTVCFDLSSTTIDPLYEIKEFKFSSEDGGESQDGGDNVFFGQDSLAYAPNCPIYYTETKHGEVAAADGEGAKKGVVLSHQWTWTDDGDDAAERLTYTLQLNHVDSGKFIMKCNVSPEHVSLRAVSAAIAITTTEETTEAVGTKRMAPSKEETAPTKTKAKSEKKKKKDDTSKSDDDDGATKPAAKDDGKGGAAAAAARCFKEEESS